MWEAGGEKRRRPSSSEWEQAGYQIVFMRTWTCLDSMFRVETSTGVMAPNSGLAGCVMN